MTERVAILFETTPTLTPTPTSSLGVMHLDLERQCRCQSTPDYNPKAWSQINGALGDFENAKLRYVYVYIYIYLYIYIHIYIYIYTPCNSGSPSFLGTTCDSFPATFAISGFHASLLGWFVGWWLTGWLASWLVGYSIPISTRCTC